MQRTRKILATSALIYANGTPHLGHLVGTIQGDIWMRFQKMQGHDCTYICGSDSHGTPIMIQAEKMGITSEALIDKMHQEQVRDFSDFYIDFDNYHRTHSAENQALVEMIYDRLLKKGHIVKRRIKQLFDPVKNMFLPDRYIKGECPFCSAKDQYGDNCESCGKTYAPTELKNPYSILSGSQPIEKESDHAFFKLQDFEVFLKDWTHHGHLQEQVTNKLDEWFKEGLREWDITRDAPYFGFPIPGEKDKYFYVWLDAPIGYIASFKNLCEKKPDLNFSSYWDHDDTTELYHFIGKDIIYFHALFWPALLHGANLRTPNAIFVNGFLTIDGQKMSKSRGTFIKARTYLDHLPPEYLRYYLAAKLSDRIEDYDIHFDDFHQRVNSDLVGKFINIASRTANFIHKEFAGKLSSICKEPELFNTFAKAGDEIAKKWDKMEFSQAIRQIMSLADIANQYIDEKKPWLLMKQEKEKGTVQEVCTMGLNLFRLLMIYLKPVLPHTAKQVEAFLNISPLTWLDKDQPLLDHTICEFIPLMNRIDPKQIEAMKMASIEEKAPIESKIESKIELKAEPKNDYISIEDFSKIDLRIAKIIEANHVEGADKLLHLKVSLGEETRDIFAGIKSAYSPDTLIGRHVVVVANLMPRKMRFGTSSGMVLAAGNGSDIWLISPDEGAEAGIKVK
jgi:methionyl-tRNA synthetase